MNHMVDNDIPSIWVRRRALLMPWLIALAILSSIALAYRFFALIDTYSGQSAFL